MEALRPRSHPQPLKITWRVWGRGLVGMDPPCSECDDDGLDVSVRVRLRGPWTPWKGSGTQQSWHQAATFDFSSSWSPPSACCCLSSSSQVHQHTRFPVVMTMTPVVTAGDDQSSQKTIMRAGSTENPGGSQNWTGSSREERHNRRHTMTGRSRINPGAGDLFWL